MRDSSESILYGSDSENVGRVVNVGGPGQALKLYRFKKNWFLQYDFNYR